MSVEPFTIELPPLSDAAAVAVLETLEELLRQFESRYFGQIHRHYHALEQMRREHRPSPFASPPDTATDDDIPF